MAAQPPISGAAVQAALTEISTQTPEQIEGATALRWGARALAAWALCNAQPVGSAGYMFWYAQAIAMKHEALEHAGWGPAGLVDALKTQLAGVP